MNFHIKVKMLVTVTVLYLAFGVNDGRVLSKCELGQDLNSTLPANLLAKIPNLVAKIVCYVGLSSQFNTSTITYVSSVPGSNGGQKCRPAEESSSEEDSEETIQVPNTGASTVKPVTSSQGTNLTSRNLKRRNVRSAESSSEESSEENIQRHKNGFKSSTVKPVTQYQDNNVTSSNGVKARNGRSAESSGDDSNSSSSEERRKRSASESSSEESSGDDSNSSSSEEHRKRSASGSSSEESSEENIQGPKLGFNSSTVKPVTKYQGDNVTSKYFRGRRYRSVESSSEESSGDDSDSSSSEERRKRSASRARSEESSEENLPPNSFNSSVVTSVTRPPVNNSVSGKGVKQRHSRSAKSNTKKCNEKNMWTLYGLFQLPDRIACTSGLKPSLNLCNLPCSSLLDDNIKDDITCFETVLNKILSKENQNGPNKELFSKLRADFFTKKCEKENDSTFSTC